MPRFGYIWLLGLSLAMPGTLFAQVQDSLMFKGQLSAWTLYNGGLDGTSLGDLLFGVPTFPLRLEAGGGKY